MSASNDDFLFAQEAQALGYVSQVQVDEGLQLQRIMAEQLKIDERLAVILVKRGWLAEEQARRVYARIEPEGKKTEIPGYRLLEFIGRGAMGTVYKALHLGLQRHVAVKVLRKDLATDRTQVERLKSEAALLASLDHPNIVRALDAGETNGFPYVVMEYVEGETLKERLQREGRLPEVEALKITRGLADALERARRMGVVHRDVKPGNVLLTRQGEPKLMDLGLAKGPMDLELTQHGATVGTPQYISPEQAQDPRKADSRSDIYSLGATLYALLTGRPPFEGTSLTEILSKVLYETPAPPRTLNPLVSAEVGYLVERMMLKDPSLRYHTPAEVVADIDRILAGRSIMPAGFRGNWEAFLLRRRIHRWVTVGAIGVAALLALGFGLNLWWERRSADEARAVGREQIAQLMPETDYGHDDTLLSVQTKILRLDEARGRLEGLDLPELSAVLARRGRLASLLECFQAWHRLKGDALSPGPRDDGSTLENLVKRHAFASALAAIQEFVPRIQPPGPPNPVLVRVAEEQGALREASRQAFVDVRKQAQEHRPVTLEAWVGGLAAYDAKAHAGFILEAEARDGVPEAGTLHASAVEVTRVVQAFEASYGREAVHERWTRREAHALEGRLRAERGRALDAALQAWRGPALAWTPSEVLFGAGGLVTARLDGVVAAARDVAREFAAAEVARAQRLRDGGRPAEAASVLGALEGDLFNAGYRDLSDEVRRPRLQMDGEVERIRARAASAYEGLVERWLTDLRALEAGTPDALRADLDLGDDVRTLLQARQATLDELRAAAGGVERLYGLALEGLRAHVDGRTRLTARPRAGSAPAKGWLVLSVDVAGRTFEVAGTSAADRPRLSLFALSPAALVDLAARAPGAAADRLALALGRLALLPSATAIEAPDSDLRAAREGYRALAQALEGAEGADALRAHAAAVLALVDRLRSQAEDGAAGLYENAKIYWAAREPRISTCWFNLRLLLTDPRYRATDFVAQHRAEIEAFVAEVRKALDQARLAGWLPGARVRQFPRNAADPRAPQSAPNVSEVHYDFDSDDQIGEANFAAGAGVLEPYGGQVITPGTGKNQRLHLLRGFLQPCRDFPLVWRSIFDPAEPITVVLDLYTGDRPFLFAVDVDGVQVAVLCLDPNWFPEFALAPDVPLLEGETEKKRPALDGQGRGRGVAFHGGLDFGDLPSWALPGRGPGSAWTPEGRGRHAAEWAAKPLQGERLFAFPPESRNGGHPYRVKVVRERGRISLFVGETLVASEQREEWARVGTGERGAGIANGSGAIRLLTYTPMAIDDLRLTGTVRRSWMEQQERKDAAEQPPR